MEYMILKSLRHVVNVFENELTTPKLKFKLYFKGVKCISVPSVDEIGDQYYSVLELVSITEYLYV